MPKATPISPWFSAFSAPVVVLTMLGTPAVTQAQANQADQECTAASIVPHTGLSSLGADLLRIAEVRGRTSGPAIRPLRRGSQEQSATICGLALPGTRPVGEEVDVEARAWRLVPVSARSIVNSAYPIDRANGAMRGGKGASASLMAGLAFRWGPVSAQAAPVVGYETNGDFATIDSAFSDRSRFAHPWMSGIDWPQRFGAESYEIVDAGESYLRADFGPVGLGVSNEILTWGGSRRYPILMGDAAPGFLHLFLGLNEAVDIGIGTVDLQLISATLSESEYFNDDAADDARRFSGVFAAFHPGGVEGLTIGAGSTLSTDAEGTQTALDLITNPLQIGDNPAGNGISSAFFRWVMAESGFEFYAEWARDDATADLEDFLGEIDHSSAWTAGFQKTDETSLGLVRVGFEMTDLKSRNTTARIRDGLRFYTHGRVRQGHTNDGQLLGSWTGPGSDAQFLELDLFREHERYGIFLERVRRDDETWEQNFAQFYQFRGHDAESVAGVRLSAARGPWLIDATASLSHRSNRSFIGLDGVKWKFLKENNFFLDVGLSWWPERSSGWRQF